MKNLYQILLSSFFILQSGCGAFQASSSFSSFSITEPQQVSNSKVVAVVSQNQILPNLQSCLNLSRDQISNSTRTALNESIEGLAPEGEVDKISAPLLMAVTKVTAEVCSDLINVEKAIDEEKDSRTYFKGFNLLNNEAGNGKEEIAVQKLASSCWGRLATEDEVQLVKESLKDVSSIANKTNKDSALFICTAVLSSSQAIRF